jgi:hypothetical protein
MIDRASPVRSVVALACLANVAGCLSVPDDPAPMCESSDQCDRASGEVCEEGVCWGNPPPGPFAAVIAPPSSRRDLVPREQAQVPIPDFGWIGELALEPPVNLSGRVVAFCQPPMTGCDSTPLAATVTISRPTQFLGGPGFNTVVNVKSGEMFSIPVPRIPRGDAPYTVVVVPDAGMTPGSGPGGLVPPMHFELELEDNLVKTITLGGLGLPTISGALTDSNALGIANYRISAIGRWDTTAPPTEVSTIDVTDAMGLFSVMLSDELVGTVELVARPVVRGTAPTIRVANIELSTTTRNIIVPANLGSPITLTDAVKVIGLDRSGTLAPVRGAVVTVTGTVTTGLTSFTVTDEQVTNADGEVSLHLLDGAAIVGAYRLSITPPPDAVVGVVYQQRFVIGQPPMVRLPSRIALRGRIVDVTGKPQPNVTITARPSLRFLWTLEPAAQAFVTAIPAATAATPDTESGAGAGGFVVWIDPNIAQVWGHYDLLIEPPAASLAPAYLRADVEVPRDATIDSFGMGDIAVPDAAYVHGRITNTNGDPVEGAELRLYRVTTTLGLCSEVAHAPVSCPIPALLQARSTSDDDGKVRLALPR